MLLAQWPSRIKIFPIAEGSKQPLVGNGWRAASDDPAQIAEWADTYPGCNWAVACGMSDLFVVDVDPQGIASWESLLEVDDEIANAVKHTYRVQTPRGGEHVYFRGNGPSTASRIAPGIDTRGGIRDGNDIVSGGYVLLPGSRTAHGAYVVIADNDIQAVPPGLLAMLPKRAKPDIVAKAKHVDLPRNVAWAVDLLRRYVSTGRVSIEGQGGNDTAYRVAASVLDKAISPEMCLDLLIEHWNPHCQPPWSIEELERIIANASRYGDETSGGAKGVMPNAEVFAAWQGYVEETPQKRIVWPLDLYAQSVSDPAWLIPDILPAKGTGIMYGASGSYKSFVALDMSLCLAYGLPGQWNAPPCRNDVLYLAGEGPVGMARKRWPAWMQWQGVDTDKEHGFWLVDHVPCIADTDAWQEIRDALRASGIKPSVIIIDTLTRLLTGLDENSAKDASIVTSFLENMARYHECFVLAIHHTGKDQTKGARGSSVFQANVDTVLSLQLHGEGTMLRVRKHKDAEIPHDPFYLAVRKIGDSIVLEKSTPVLKTEDRVISMNVPDWAAPHEIVPIILRAGGEIAHHHLVDEIINTHQLKDKRVVSRILKANHDLAFLRDGEIWRLPERPTDESFLEE